MSLLDLIIVVTRWAHVMATVTWVGGNVFFLVVLRPALRRSGAPPGDLGRRIGAGFKEAVDLSMWVLIITGGVLIYDRLTVNIEMPYLVVLGVKLLLSGTMFLLALSLGRRGPQRRSSPLEGGWAEVLPRGLGAALVAGQARLGRLLTPTMLLAALGPAIVFLGLLLRSM